MPALGMSYGGKIALLPGQVAGSSPEAPARLGFFMNLVRGLSWRNAIEAHPQCPTAERLPPDFFIRFTAVKAQITFGPDWRRLIRVALPSRRSTRCDGRRDGADQA